MPSNIEIKLRVEDLGQVESIAASIADSGPTYLVQEDVFYNADSGRLKLRKFGDGKAELISYHREDSDTARESEWLAYSTLESDSLEGVLDKSLGRAITVRKRRTLYLIGNTRIHLDQVEDLGSFVELEVVLESNDSHSKSLGAKVAEELIGKLGLATAPRMSHAYADLLENK